MRRKAAIAVVGLLILSSVAVLEVTLPGSILGLLGPGQGMLTPPIVTEKYVDGMTWVCYDNSEPGTPADAHDLVSDTTGITVVWDFYGFWKHDYERGGVEYDAIDMPGASHMNQPGRPMLPRVTKFLEIPHDVDVTLDVISSKSSIVGDYNIRPADKFEVPIDRNVTPAPLDDVYSTDAFFPVEIHQVLGDLSDSAMIMRGRRLLEISICPIQFNPLQLELTVYSQIIIRINYNVPSQIDFSNESQWSEAFEEIFARCIINYHRPRFCCGFGLLPNWTDIDAAEYLIVTTLEYKDAADRLAEWKTQKGVLTKVRTAHSINTADHVASIIQTAYNFWHPAPTFVLILGDSEDIPPRYLTQHPDLNMDGVYTYGEEGYIGSDLHYFAIEGDDYFPEMIYGRISVDSLEQAQNAVDKIIAYEKEPNMQHSEFYDTALSLAHFEDVGYMTGYFSGYENPSGNFIYTAENVRRYLSSVGYDVRRNYTAYLCEKYVCPSFSPPAQLWNGIRYTDLTEFGLENYEWLDASYRYSADNMVNNITDHLNRGRFLVYYIDHGESVNQFDITSGERDNNEGWNHPYYNVTYTHALMNKGNLSFIISLACNTGWFDGESDGEQNAMGDARFTDYDGECFAENMTRLEGGAIAMIAASRYVYGISGHAMLDGIIQALWPGHLNYENQPIYEMGAALLFGKLHSYREYNEEPASPQISYISGAQATQTLFEAYHLLGDPETQLWTSQPSEFNVTTPYSVGTSNPQRFVINVENLTSNEPVHFAKVCIMQGNQIYEVGYTDPKGQVLFDVDPVSEPNITVTVTKHNFKPDVSFIPVYDSTARFVSLSSVSGMAGDDIDFSVYGFHPGSTVEIYFDNVLFATLNPGVTGGTEEVPADLEGYVNVWAAEPTISPFRVDWNPVTTERFRCLTVDDGPDLHIDSQPFGGMMWILYDNPDIEVAEEMLFIDSDVIVTVHNNGDLPAHGTKVTLSHAQYGGGLSWKEIETKTVNLERHDSLDVGFAWSPLLPVDVCLQVSLFHDDEPEEDRIDNIGYENYVVVPLASPGQFLFHIGNPTDDGTPTDERNYVSIVVRQNGNESEILRTTILDIPTQQLRDGTNESVIIHIDSEDKLEVGESRLFTAYFYVNGAIVGGMTFNATQGSFDWTGVIVIVTGGLIVIVALVLLFKKR